MFYLMKFEWKKMRRAMFFKVLLLLLVVGIASYYSYIYSQTVRSDEIITNLEADLKLSENHLSELIEYEKTVLNRDAKLSTSEQNDLDFYRMRVPLLKQSIQGIQTGNWTLWAEAEHALQNFEYIIGTKQDWERTYPTRYTIQTHQSMLNWFAEHNIEPIWPTYIWLTDYDEVFNEGVEAIVRSNFDKRHASSGSYFSYHLFSQFFTIIGIIFFLFMFSDIFTKEGEGKNGPIQLLRTQPIPKSFVLLSKYSSTLLMTIGILLGTLLFSIGLGTIADRFGDWDYPILIYGEHYTYEWIPLGLFLLKSSGLFLLLLLFSYSLLFFLSVLTNRAVVATGFTLAILFLGMQWAEQTTMTNLAPYNPFHYVNVFSIMTNEYALTHNNYSFSFETGAISLGIFTLIVLIMTSILSVYRYRSRG